MRMTPWIGVFLLLLLPGAARAQPPAQARLDCQSWADFGKAWDAYLAHPSPALAEAAFGRIPSVKLDACPERLNVKERMDRGSPVLEKAIRGGDRMALRLALRLIGISDGALAEGFQEMAGGMLEKSAETFLEELKRAGGDRYCPGPSLYNLYEQDEALDGSREAQARIRARMAKIEAVTSKKLARVQKACLDQYQQLLKEQEKEE